MAVSGTRSRALYDRDFWTGSRQQVAAVRRRDVGAIDWENVIEEIETLGRSEEHSWTSYCKNVISHLLKIEHSAAKEARNHWRQEIETWRVEMHRTLQDNTGMKAKFPEMLGKAWSRGLEDALTALAREGDPIYAVEKRQWRNWGSGCRWSTHTAS